MMLGGLPFFKGLLQATSVKGKTVAADAAGLTMGGTLIRASEGAVQSGTTHSPVLADHGKTFFYTNGATVTVTLPAASGLFDGWQINIVRQGAGRVDVVRSGSDTIISQGSALATMSLPSASDGGLLTLDKANTRFFWRGSRSFESAEITLATSTNDTQAHNLNLIPRDYNLFLRCKTGELGFTAGDEIVQGHGGDATSTQRQHQLTVDGTNGVVSMGSLGATSLAGLLNKGTPAGFVSLSTSGNWRFFWRARVVN